MLLLLMGIGIIMFSQTKHLHLAKRLSMLMGNCIHLQRALLEELHRIKYLL